MPDARTRSLHKTAVCFTVFAALLIGSCTTEGPTGGGNPTPATLSLISGSGQSDTIGANLADPLVVRVLSSDSRGVPNVTVRFQASGNGSVATDLATTDATGAAFTHWKLRTLAGADTVIATVSVLTGQQARFTATVNAGRLATLVLSPDTIRFFKLQDTTAAIATAFDRAHNAVVLPTLIWSTATSTIATVTGQGVVRSVARGATTVKATDNGTGVRDSAVVTVDQFPKTIAVTPASDTLNWLGETLSLSATARDSAGLAITGVPITWTSLDQAVATVDAAGTVNAEFAGVARIVARYLTVADTGTITVRQVPARVSIAVDPDTLIAFSDTAHGGGFVLDSGNAIISIATIDWSSSNGAVAEVVAPKRIVARANGGAIVTGSFGSLTDTEALVVRQQLASLRLLPGSATLAIDQTTQFRATPFDRNGFEIDTTIVPVSGTWRPLNVNWLAVSPSGLATARAAGAAGVVFQHDTVTDTSLVTVLAPNLGAVTSWDWKNPLPQGNTLLGVNGSADNNIYAVGAIGTIAHFDGVSWTTNPRLDVLTFTDAWVSPTGQLFAAGGQNLGGPGVVARGYGAPWTVDTVPPYGPVRAIWGVSDTSVFVLNDAFRVLKFDGTAWSEIGSLPLLNTADLEGVSSQLLYVTGSVQQGLNQVGTIYKYNGATWNEVYRGFVIVSDLWIAPDSSVFAVATKNDCFTTLLHSTDGAVWDSVTVWSDFITHIHGRTPQDIYGTGGCNGSAAIVHWDGITSTVVHPASENAPTQIWGNAATGHWTAVGASGAILTNSGAGWQTATTGLRGYPYVSRFSVWAAGVDDAWMTTFDARVMHWNGSTLAEVPNPLGGVLSPISGQQRQFSAAWGTSSSNLYVGGGSTCFAPPLNCDGALLHFNGTSWNVIYSQGIIINAIWGSAPDDIFALGNEGGWHFDGTNWNRTGQGVFDGDRIASIWGFRADDVWACGGSLYHYDGHAWTKVSQPPMFCMALTGFAKNDVYMAGFENSTGLNAIAHYDGFSWTVVHGDRGPSYGGYYDGGIWGSGPNDVHAIFSSEYLRFNGNSWQNQQLAPMSPMMFMGDSHGRIYGNGEVAGFVVGHQ